MVCELYLNTAVYETNKNPLLVRQPTQSTPLIISWMQPYDVRNIYLLNFERWEPAGEGNTWGGGWRRKKIL